MSSSSPPPLHLSLAQSLKHGHMRTDEAFLRLAAGSGDVSGSTAISLMLNSAEGRCVVANLGDSRALLCRGGRFEELTRDHTARDEGERRRVLGAGGEVRGERVGGALAVSRAIGDMDERTGRKLRGLSAAPEVREVELGVDFEFVLVACDGCWELGPSEMFFIFAFLELLVSFVFRSILKAFVLF